MPTGKVYSTKTVITRFVNKVEAVLGEDLLDRDNPMRADSVGSILDRLMQADYAASQPADDEEGA